LLAWSALHLWYPLLAIVPASLLGLLFLLFALQTLRLQKQRKRRLADVTLDFWQWAMGCLMLAVVAWGLGQWLAWPPLDILVGALFLLGFATSAVNGMLYKIVPFLVWLHLNNRLQAQGSWQGSVPNMKQIIPVSATRRQFRLHLFALLVLLVTLGLPEMLPAWIAGGLWLANAGYLWWNLLQALLLYRKSLQQAESG